MRDDFSCSCITIGMQPADEPKAIVASSNGSVSDAAVLAKSAHLETEVKELQIKLQKAEKGTRTHLEELVQHTARSFCLKLAVINHAWYAACCPLGKRPQRCWRTNVLEPSNNCPSSKLIMSGLKLSFEC